MPQKRKPTSSAKPLTKQDLADFGKGLLASFDKSLDTKLDTKLATQKQDILKEMDIKLEKQKDAIVKDVAEYIADSIVPLFDKHDKRISNLESRVGIRTAN